MRNLFLPLLALLFMSAGAQEAGDALRAEPLPYMTVRNAVPDSDVFWDIPVSQPLSAEALQALENSPVPTKAPLVLKKPRIFKTDMEEPSAGGDEEALFLILQEYFRKWDWENAAASLREYLSQSLPKDLESRARFYFGQSLYFTEKYREALFEFMSVKPLHPVEANVWIEAVLTAMVY
jgi:TolA-binding protein